MGTRPSAPPDDSGPLAGTPEAELDEETRRYVAALKRPSAPDVSDLEPVDVRQAPARGATARPQRSRDLRLPAPGGPIRARLHLPPQQAARDRSSGLLVYLHGGGFVAGTLEGSDSVCQAFAGGAGCHVLSIDYRLAPEAPFPAAVEDGLAALRWAQDSAQWGQWRDDRLAIGGESAGGNLAAVCAQQWREGAASPLRLQLLICPLTDFRTARWPSRKTLSHSAVLPESTLLWFEQHYLRSEAERDDPRASPLAAADLSGLPPAHVVTAQADPLRDEGEAYAHALQEAGVRVTLERFASIHGFVGLHEALTQGRQALDSCVRALAAAIG